MEIMYWSRWHCFISKSFLSFPQIHIETYLPSSGPNENPSLSRATPDRFFVLVNQRPVSHKSIEKVRVVYSCKMQFITYFVIHHAAFLDSLLIMLFLLLFTHYLTFYLPSWSKSHSSFSSVSHMANISNLINILPVCFLVSHSLEPHFMHFYWPKHYNFKL